MGSLIMTQADKAKVPAGSALAVDRDVFSQGVTRAFAEHPNVDIVRERIDALPHTGMTIVATGPLTAMSLAESIGAATGKEALAFFDAIAPIVYRDSIDMDICWMASRWDKVGPEGDGKRSEEHTSELQSLMRISYAVFCLQKKKKQRIKASST